MSIHPGFYQVIHSLITAGLRRSDRDDHPTARRVQRRSWRQFDIEAYSFDLRQLVEPVIQSPGPDVNGLFLLYDTAMRHYTSRRGLTKIAVLQKSSGVGLKDITDVSRHLRHWRFRAYTQGQSGNFSKTSSSGTGHGKFRAAEESARQSGLSQSACQNHIRPLYHTSW